MSTRGIIARGDPTTWTGRYHHWDSYPKGLGASLWRLYRGHFARDLGAMLQTLLEDHPSGWSTIVNRDFAQTPGFVGAEDPLRRPQCYCHGARAETAHLLTPEFCDCGAEWLYILGVVDGAATMHVFEAVCADGEHAYGMFGQDIGRAGWSLRATVDLGANGEPDWAAMKGAT